MINLIEFIEAGFNKAFSNLTEEIKGGYMTLTEKISELQLAASEERQQVRVRIDSLQAQISELKQLTTGNETIVGQLTAKLNAKDAEIDNLKSLLEMSQKEINESVAAVESAIAEVRGIYNEPTPPQA